MLISYDFIKNNNFIVCYRISFLKFKKKKKTRETPLHALPEMYGSYGLGIAESKMQEFHQVAIQRHGSSHFTNTKGKPFLQNPVQKKTLLTEI